MPGWIKLHRELLNWEWFQDPNMVRVWIYMLLKANHEPRNWKGVTINPGQFVGGRKTIASGTGLSEQNIRTCIDKLKSTNEITIKSTNKFSVFEIIKWKSYQLEEEGNQQINQESTSELTNNQPQTRSKEVKKLNTISSTEIESVYESYPTRCPIRGASNGKGSKHKEKIRAILLSKKHTAVELIRIIKAYVNDCKENNSYMKNFGTFLNNIPDDLLDAVVPSKYSNQVDYSSEEFQVFDSEEWEKANKEARGA